MRRITFMLVAGAAVLAVLPATALARHHHRSHQTRVHHARARHEHFGTSDTVGQPAGAMHQNAGTVQNFTPNTNGGGVLTIVLNDMSPVTGTVTRDTEIKCEAPEEQSPMRSHDEGPGGGEEAARATTTREGDDDGGEDQGEAGHMCGTASLIRGAGVAEAELNLSSAGAIWKEVDLVTGLARGTRSGGSSRVAAPPPSEGLSWTAGRPDSNFGSLVAHMSTAEPLFAARARARGLAPARARATKELSLERGDMRELGGPRVAVARR